MKFVKQPKKIFSKKRHFAGFTVAERDFLEAALERTETDTHSNLLDDLKEVFSEIEANGLILKDLSSSANTLTFIIGYDEDYLEEGQNSMDTLISIESKLPIRTILGILGFSEYDDEELAVELDDFIHNLGNFSRKKAARK